MRNSVFLVGAAIIGATMLAPPILAQGKPQTITLMKVDPQTLATGFRVSKVLGATVLNDANEKVGTIDDLIVTPTDKVPVRRAVGRRLSWHGHEAGSRAIRRNKGRRQEHGPSGRHKGFTEDASRFQLRRVAAPGGPAAYPAPLLPLPEVELAGAAANLGSARKLSGKETQLLT